VGTETAASEAGPRAAEQGGIWALAGPEIAQMFVVLLWASTFIVTKAIYAELSPLAFLAVRFVLMTALAFGVLAARQRGETWRIRRADLPRFVLAALSGYTLYQLGFALGLDHTSPFSSSLLIAMVPLFTVVILAILGERTPPQAWIGIAVAVVGVVVFLLDKWGDRGSLVGDALSLGAALAFAVYGVVNRPLVARYPPATYTAWTLLLGTMPLLVIAGPAAVAQPWGAVSGAAWLGTLYMVVFPVYIAYQLWNWAIQHRGAATATTFSLLVPIVSGVLSALVFHEGFGAAKLSGAALVLAGLVIVRLPRQRPAGEGSE
jgi:drug/metabolite transporter (DMT)-like permease